MFTDLNEVSIYYILPSKIDTQTAVNQSLR